MSIIHSPSVPFGAGTAQVADSTTWSSGRASSSASRLLRRVNEVARLPSEILGEEGPKVLRAPGGRDALHLLKEGAEVALALPVTLRSGSTCASTMTAGATTSPTGWTKPSHSWCAKMRF